MQDDKPLGIGCDSYRQQITDHARALTPHVHAGVTLAQMALMALLLCQYTAIFIRVINKYNYMFADQGSSPVRRGCTAP